MTPARKIVVNGTDKTAEYNQRFMSLEIVDEAGLSSDTLTITLSDDGDIAFPEKKSELQIWTGYQKPGEPPLLFFRGLYSVNDVILGFPERTMTITASAARMRSGFVAPKDQTWEQVTLGDMAASVAKRHGFTLNISPELAAKGIEYHDQKSQSDSDMLTRLVELHGGTLKPAGDQLVIFQKGDGRNVSGKDLPPVPITLNKQTRGSVRLSGRNHYRSVAAHYSVEGGQETLATSSQEPQMLLPEKYETRAQAEAAIKSETLKLQRKQYELRMNRMPANPELRAERMIDLSGHGREQIDGLWVVNSLTETQDSGGYWMSFTASTPRQYPERVPEIS